MDGTPSDYSVCINAIETPGEPKKWEVYYSERGRKCDPVRFDREEDAYDYVYSIAKRTGTPEYRKSSVGEKAEAVYTTTVKVRKILQGKPLRMVCILLGMWLVLTLSSICLLGVTYYAVPVMFVLFLSIIPVMIVIRNMTKPFKGPQSFENKEVTFRAVDGVLYQDDVKIDAAFDEAGESITVNDIRVYSGSRYLSGTYRASFIGIVEKPYMEGFLKFLQEQGIAITDSD